MAEETTTVEKHYCYDHPSAYQNNDALIGAIMSSNKSNSSDPAMMAMMNNNWQNNPFMYLIWLAFFGGGNGFGWGNRADAAQTTAENYNSRQIAALQDTVNTNHNNDLALQAINGNRDALGQLAQTFNTDLNSISSAIANVQSAIQQVGGQVGFSAESVKNAIALGDSNIVAKMQECCCSNKLLTQQMGYEAQLRDQSNTGIITSQMAAQHSANALQSANNQSALLSRIDQLANGVQTGFAQIGYQSEKNTSAIIQNATANTQRILDQMCANQTQSLRDTIADKDRQLQTQTIINQLNNSGCTCIG